MANKFNFEEWLNPFKDVATKELKQRYAKAYRNIQKRMKTFQKPRYQDIANTKLGREAQRYATRFPSLSNIQDRESLEDLLIEAEDFLGRKTTSVAGLRSSRAKRVRSLRESGYTWVNNTNIEQFGAFMNAWRETYGYSAGSPTPAQMQSVKKALNKLTPEQVKKAFDNYVKTGKLIV